ncbi:MAG: hypothetical protein JNN02_05730 [Tabrizicola sp.]|nr:hypothetical protein [Tabrizicola sp.]
MSMVAVHQMVERVSQLMEEKHGIGGRDLATKLRRGRRLLPRKLRDAADRLVEADEKAKNPKLRGQIDLGQVAEDYDACVRHLSAIDTVERRRGTVRGMVETVGIGVLVFGIGATGLAWWLGVL